MAYTSESELCKHVNKKAVENCRLILKGENKMHIEEIKKIAMELGYDAEIANTNKVNETREGVRIFPKGGANDNNRIGIVIYPSDYLTPEMLIKKLKEEEKKLNAIDRIVENKEHMLVTKCALNAERNKDIAQRIEHTKVCDLLIVNKAIYETETERYILTPDKAELIKDCKQARPVIDHQGFTYAVTNETATFGSGLIADTRFLKEFFDKHGEFYIIPMSIHALIFIPKTEADENGLSVNELKQTVEHTNATAIDPKDFLSNNVYIFDGENVSIAQ